MILDNSSSHIYRTEVQSLPNHPKNLIVHDKYLKLKLKQNLKSYKEARRHIKVAQDYFGDRNVKEINGADIEDYLYSIDGISEKTRTGDCQKINSKAKEPLLTGLSAVGYMEQW